MYINIEFPGNVEIFSNYLKLSTGDVEEFNSFIPSVSTYFID